MKKVKYNVLLVGFIFSSLLLQYCRKEKENKFRTFIDTFKFSQSFKNRDSVKYMPNYMPDDSIVMGMNDSLHFFIEAHTTTIQIAFVNAGGNLYGTSPTPPPEIEQDSLQIITLSDFDSLHKSGSNVGDLFLVSNPDYFDKVFYTISEFGTLRDKLHYYDRSRFVLTLIKKPDNNVLNVKLLFYDKEINDGIQAISPLFRFK